MNICVFASFFRPLSFWKVGYSYSAEKNLTLQCNVASALEANTSDKKILSEEIDDGTLVSTSIPCLKTEFEPLRERSATFSNHQTESADPQQTGRTDFKMPFPIMFASVESIPTSITDLSAKKMINSNTYTMSDSTQNKLYENKKRKYINWSLLKEFRFQMINWGLFCGNIRSSYAVLLCANSCRRTWLL